MSYALTDYSATEIQLNDGTRDYYYKKCYCSVELQGEYIVLTSHKVENNAFRQQWSIAYTDFTTPTGTASAVYNAIKTIIENYAGGGGGSGTVTSVDISVPSAFALSGNPITTSGTIAITGAGTTAQYIDGTGALQTFPDSANSMITIGRNSTGSILYQGTVIYINGSTGNRPNFVKAQANAESTSAGTFGVITADIANNSDGYACTIGTLNNLDTRTTATHPFTDVTLADGDTIYLHPTIAGYVTNVKPHAPYHLVYVGKVVRTHPTLGTIVYRIQNGYEMDELHNVQAQSPALKDTLYYDTADSQWKTASIGTILGYTPVAGNAAITGATKTKITYDSKGLVTAGADATTADIADSTNKRYVTDAQLTVIGNTSGTNTGDQTLAGLGGVATSRTISTTSPLTGGGDLSANRTLAINQAATGTDGYLSSTDWNTFNNKALSWQQYRKASRWFNNGIFGPAGGSFTNVANNIRYIPVYIDQDITITRMALNVSGAAPVSSTARLGIYTNDSTTCQPLTRLVDTGNIDIVTLNARIVTGLSVALTKGLYWFAYVSNAGSGTITGIGTNFVLDVKGLANVQGIGFASLNQSFTYGALPATAGTLTEVNGTSTLCIFYSF